MQSKSMKTKHHPCPSTIGTLLCTIFWQLMKLLHPFKFLFIHNFLFHFCLDGKNNWNESSLGLSKVPLQAISQASWIEQNYIYINWTKFIKKLRWIKQLTWSSYKTQQHKAQQHKIQSAKKKKNRKKIIHLMAWITIPPTNRIYKFWSTWNIFKAKEVTILKISQLLTQVSTME